MSKNSKDKLIEKIESLMGYNKSLIDPKLYKYLSIDELQNIYEKAKSKSVTLDGETKEWLKQFKKED